MHKVRLTYTKTKQAIYISSIDISDVIAKALTRVGAKLVYNEGKTKKPEIVSACTLPIGFESTGEICDVIIKDHIAEAYLVRELNKTLPQGMIINSAIYVDINEEDINKRVYAAIYEIELIHEDEKFEGKNNREIKEIKEWYLKMFSEYLSEPAILVLKKTPYRQERINIKPYLIEHEFMLDGRLRITVCTGKEKMLNPEYIIIGYVEYISEMVEYNIKRTKIIYK